MYCIKCGTKLPDEAKFCFKCGSPVEVTVAEDNAPQVTTQPVEELQNVKQKELLTSAFVNDMSKKGRGNPRIYKSFKFGYGEKSTAFVFVTPFDMKRTMDLIYYIYKNKGFNSGINRKQGHVKCELAIPWHERFSFETYIVPMGNNGCKVRTTIQTIWKQPTNVKIMDIAFDTFLKEIFKLEPTVNFGVSLANKAPYVIAVNKVGSNIATQTDTITKQNPNIGGMLAGEFFFGQAGAVVGGMSGKTKNTSVTRDVFVKNRLASVIFNNGRIYEGEIREGTPLYNEVMAKIL